MVSLRDFFEVPKGKDDIRKVYNGTSSGLWLPTAETSLRLLKTASYCGDMDLGEMFLNLPMDTHIRSYAVVDLCSIQDLLPASLSNPRVRWNRLFMGMLPSAYHAVEQFYKNSARETKVHPCFLVPATDHPYTKLAT